MTRAGTDFRALNQVVQYDAEYAVSFYKLLECNRPIASLKPVHQIVKAFLPPIHIWPKPAGRRQGSVPPNVGPGDEGENGDYEDSDKKLHDWGLSLEALEDEMNDPGHAGEGGSSGSGGASGSGGPGHAHPAGGSGEGAPLAGAFDFDTHTDNDGDDPQVESKPL